MSELAEPVAMVRHMFDAVAADYDQSGVEFFQPIATRLLGLLDVAPGEDALDLGCGRGAVSVRLAESGARVTAVDLSPVMVALTREAVAGHDVTVLEMDATRPALPEASFDVLTSSLVLFFLPDPRDALSRWLRLLRPGGRFGVTTFGKADPTFEALGDLFDPFIPKELLDPLNEREQDDPFASVETLTALAEAAGGSDVRVVEVDLPVELADVHAWRRWTMSTGQRMFWGGWTTPSRPPRWPAPRSSSSPRAAPTAARSCTWGCAARSGAGRPGDAGRLPRMTEEMTRYETEPARSAYHDALPIGERLSAQPLLESPFFGIEGDLRMQPLEPMLVPEQPRSGVEDPSACFHCGPGLEHAFWADEHWHVGAGPDTGLPFVAGLAPNAHVRLDEMDAALLATFGEVTQRLAGAIQGLDGVARTHFSRWGDGSAHFHMHFMARPLGMMQGRGAMLAFWDDVLPRVDADLFAANRRQVAAVMAEGGGTSRL